MMTEHVFGVKRRARRRRQRSVRTRVVSDRDSPRRVSRTASVCAPGGPGEPERSSTRFCCDGGRWRTRPRRCRRDASARLRARQACARRAVGRREPLPPPRRSGRTATPRAATRDDRRFAPTHGARAGRHGVAVQRRRSRSAIAARTASAAGAGCRRPGEARLEAGARHDRRGTRRCSPAAIVGSHAARRTSSP